MRNDLETIKAELTRLRRRIGNLPATDRRPLEGEEADPDAVFTREQIRKLGLTIADAEAQIVCAEVATHGYDD